MADRDVHAGLDDLDDDLDVAQLARETRGGAPTGADPLRAASATLRSGDPDAVDGADAGDEPDDDAGGTDAGADDGQEGLDADDQDAAEREDAGEEDAGDEEKGKDGDEAKAEGADKGKKPTFELEVPPIAERGGRAKVSFVFDGLNQEQHDLLAGHLRRSAELGATRAQLEEARQAEASARFISEHPLEAMLLLDIEDGRSGAPQRVGAQFVEEWLRQHPDEGLKLVQKLKYDDAEALDADQLADRAESAALKAHDRVTKALSRSRETSHLQVFVAETGAYIREAMGSLDLEEDDQADFANLAANRVKRVYDSRVRRGRDPFLTRADVLELIQPIIQRFAPASNGAPGSRPAAPGRPGAQRQDPTRTADRLKHRQRVAATHARIAGGKQTQQPAGGVTVSKFKGAVGVKEASQRLRGSG